jgi:restriction endonuclease S subunit
MSIGIKDLKAMMIPLPPLEEQKRIAARYIEAMEEVLRLKVQLQDATERMKRVFEDSV